MDLSKIVGKNKDEVFNVRGMSGEFKVDCNELLRRRDNEKYEWAYVDSKTTLAVIKLSPDGIIDLPPLLTNDQKDQLRALYTLGYRWLAKDFCQIVFAYHTMPTKKDRVWWDENDGGMAAIHEWMPEGIVASLVSWSDDEPFDIGKAVSRKLI